MEFVQDVKGGFENGKVEVAYSVGDKGGLLEFEGKLKASPFALLKLLAAQTKMQADDKFVEILEGLLVKAKEEVAAAAPASDPVV